MTRTLKYDAENRLIEVWQGAALLALYTYDGQGHRIRTTQGNVTTTCISHLAEWTEAWSPRVGGTGYDGLPFSEQGYGMKRSETGQSHPARVAVVVWL